MAVFQFFKEQRIPASVDEVWDFISSPKNLSKITPDSMGFEITTPYLSDKMYPGMIITYKVSPMLNVKMTWVTEITHVKEKEYFVDEQREGPYKTWHHEHWVKPIEGGVMMEDLITYQPPMGIFGKAANDLFIRKKLEEIFEYRRLALIELFGKFEEKSA